MQGARQRRASPDDAAHRRENHEVEVMIPPKRIARLGARSQRHPVELPLPPKTCFGSMWR